MRVGLALEDLIAAAYTEQTGSGCAASTGSGSLGPSRGPRPVPTPPSSASTGCWRSSGAARAPASPAGCPRTSKRSANGRRFVAEVGQVDVAALTVGDDDARIFTVHADEGLQRHLVAIASDFRRRLAEGGPFAQSLDSLKRKYPADDGSEIEADADIGRGRPRALGSPRSPAGSSRSRRPSWRRRSRPAWRPAAHPPRRRLRRDVEARQGHRNDRLEAVADGLLRHTARAGPRRARRAAHDRQGGRSLLPGRVEEGGRNVTETAVAIGTAETGARPRTPQGDRPRPARARAARARASPSRERYEPRPDARAHRPHRRAGRTSRGTRCSTSRTAPGSSTASR